MKNIKTKKGTRFVAMIMAIILVFSTFAVLSTVSVSAATNSDMSSLIEIGIDNLASILATSNPYATASRALSGAFKLFLAGTSSSPSTQDIMNKLEEMQTQMTDYYNQEKALLDRIDIKIEELQFKDLMNELVEFNHDALVVLSKHLDDNIPENETISVATPDQENKSREEKLRDIYHQITQYTTDIKSYMHIIDVIGNAITSPIIRARAFDLYEEELRKTTDNADVIKEQLDSFIELCTGQYMIAYSIRLTGYCAQEKLYVLDDNQAGISSIHGLADADYVNAKAVSEEYKAVKDRLSKIEKCKINDGTKTTPYASFADAWIDVSKMSGNVSITLNQDIIINEGETFARDLSLHQGEASAFKNGNLYVNNDKLNLTINLNGFTIKRDEVTNPSLVFDKTNATIMNGTVDEIKSTHGDFTARGVKFVGTGGTGLYLEYSPLYIVDSDFSGYTDSAIKSYYYKSEICNCSFKDCTGSNGAGIYIKNADSQITSCTLYSCSAKSNGGGIYTTGSNVKVDSSKFALCSANNGGGMYCNEDAELTDCEFSNCTATDDGGGYCQGYFGDGFTSNFKLTGCDFYHNHANDDGGGIYADSMSYAKLKDIDVESNTSGSDGAGMYCQKGKGSACDPDMYGTIIIINNNKDNGTNSNLFLGENTTSKCVVHLNSVDRTKSKIGITSPTSDDDLDITGKQDVDYSGIFTYDTSKYRIHGYKGFFGGRYVEIVKR